MPSRGNVGDNGILAEARQLIEVGSAKTMCEALQILMNKARGGRDKAKQEKIKATQKAKGCRRCRKR
ncbi:MAG TPA: polymorphic toxin type 34 domain-containing protein [Waterburya sp.]|jgi:hypothetical protein